MSTIKCPKCKLNQADDSRRCRRCGAPLSLGAGRNVFPKSFAAKRAVYYLAVSVIAVLVAAFVHGVHDYLYSASDYGSRPAAIEEVAKRLPVNRELEEVKQLHRDFIARFDHNAADHTGDELNKNQILTFAMIMQLKEERNKITDSEAQEHLSKFFRLLEKYYDQLVQYNSESAHLAEVRRRICAERDLVMKDSSLSKEIRSAKLVDLWNQNRQEIQSTTVSANDLDETAKSLHNL
jgi:hypothetical protein